MLDPIDIKFFRQIAISVSKYLLSISVTNWWPDLWTITSIQITFWVTQWSVLWRFYFYMKSLQRFSHYCTSCFFSFPTAYQHEFISSILTKPLLTELDYPPTTSFLCSFFFSTAKCLKKWPVLCLISLLPFSHFLWDPVQVSFHLHHSTEMFLSRSPVTSIY